MLGSHDLSTMAGVATLAASGSRLAAATTPAQKIEADLVSVKEKSLGTEKTATGEIEYVMASMVEEKYLTTGNLSDLCSTVKNGELPSGALILRSLADILNLLTFNLLHGVLDPVRLEPHARQKLLVRSYSSETVNGVRQESERTLNSDEERIRRYLPGEDSPKHILVTREEKIIQNDQEVRHITHVQETAYTIAEGASVNDVESARLAMAEGSGVTLKDTAVIEQQIVSTTQHVKTTDGKETIMIANFDVGDFLGRNGLYNHSDVESSGTVSRRTYLIEDPEARGLDGRLDSVDLSRSGTLVEEQSAAIDPQRTSVDNEVEFSEGYLSYVPVAGSITNIGAKMHYGAEIGVSDAFWATLDMAGGAGMAAGLAGKAAAKAVAKSAVSAGAKTELAAAGGKKMLREGVEEASEKLVGKLKPNTEYMENGYRSVSDEMGRLKKISGELQLKPATRDLAAQNTARSMGLATDDAGHMIGARFNGPSGLPNLVPQNAHLNRGAWKKMENQFEKHLREGSKVSVDVRPNYTGSNLRPDSFSVRYRVDDGRTYTKYFENTGAAA